MLADAPRMAFVPVSDGDRAKTFYETTLGLRFIEQTQFAVVFEGPAGELRLAITPDFTPQPFSILGWTVGDIQGAMTELAGRGVTFERFEGVPQDDAGIWTVPDGKRICWFRDPDGNLLSLTQNA